MEDDGRHTRLPQVREVEVELPEDLDPRDLLHPNSAMVEATLLGRTARRSQSSDYRGCTCTPADSGFGAAEMASATWATTVRT
jgi:hypothetical protein